jgi:hypothetical protein
MQSLPTISFHEASIIDFVVKGETITLKLEGVRLGEETHTAVIQLKGVRTLTRDGIGVQDLVSEPEDGEVLTLEYTESTLYLIVEWTDFKRHHSETHSYQIICNSIQVELL